MAGVERPKETWIASARRRYKIKCARIGVKAVVMNKIATLEENLVIFS